MKNSFKKNKGFVALISVLFVSAITLTIAIGLSLRSVGETNMVIAEEASHKALGMADLCAEYAVRKLKDDLNYAGNETLVVDGMSCDILAVGGTGNSNRTIKTQSAVFKQTKKIKIVITQVNPTSIYSWEEVANF